MQGRGNLRAASEDDHIVNHDNCDSCGDGGDLLCCDNCPRSFHFNCINPPVTPDELSSMKGDWYCNQCRAKLHPSKSSAIPNSPLSPLFEKLERSNPKVFFLPADIKALAQPSESSKEKNPGDTEDSTVGEPKPSKKRTGKVKLKDEPCCICGLGAENNQLVNCYLCGRSYHAYCLEPPLLNLPSEPWQCHLHSDGRRVTHLLPDQKFRLDFFPSKRRKTDTESEDNHIDGGADPKSKANGKTTDDSAQRTTNWLLDLAKDHSRNDVYLSPSAHLAYLRQEQDRFTKFAMPSNVTVGVSGISNTNTNPLVLSQLTPLFTQFLAWQRLMQINSQIQQVLESQEIPQEKDIRSTSASTSEAMNVPSPESPALPVPTASTSTSHKKAEETTKSANNLASRTRRRGRNTVTSTPSTPLSTASGSTISTPGSAGATPIREGDMMDISTLSTAAALVPRSTEAPYPSTSAIVYKPPSKKITSTPRVASIPSTGSLLSIKTPPDLSWLTGQKPLVSSTPTSAPLSTSTSTPTSISTTSASASASASGITVISTPFHTTAVPVTVVVATTATPTSPTSASTTTGTSAVASVPTLTSSTATSNFTPTPTSSASVSSLTPADSQAKSGVSDGSIAFLTDEVGQVLCRMKKNTLMIGRKKSNVDFDLSNFAGNLAKTISRNHCEIRYDDASKTFSMFNLGRNGTRVDGTLYMDTNPIPLKDFAIISFGSAGKPRFIFRTERK